MADRARFHSIDVGDHRFQGLGAVLAYWDDRRGGRLAPAWDDINLIELPPALIPRMCVIDVVPEPLEFRYRFWGTQITGMHHYDLTGRSVRNLTPAAYADAIFQQYAAVMEERAPRAFITEVPLDDGRVTFYATIRLPLSSDGTTIDKLMSAEEYGDEKRSLERVFESLGAAGS